MIIARLRWLLVLCTVGASVPSAASAVGSMLDEAPPRTPEGLEACTAPLEPAVRTMPSPGEVVEYDLEVLGLGLGTVELTTARRGQFQGEPVTEYRGEVKANRILSALMPLEGAAASLVADESLTPMQAASRYRWATVRASEVQTFSAGGQEVSSRRRDNDTEISHHRRFHAPVQDLLSAFYYLRRLPSDTRGCSLVSANGRAYTIWLTPEGRERVETPLGAKEATRYFVRYASDEASYVKEARIWVGEDEPRVPYKAEGLNAYHPTVALRRYSP